jgi:DNA-binding CsgD family transcriptional regulator
MIGTMLLVEDATQGLDPVPAERHTSPLEVVEALKLPSIAECAEAVIEGLDAAVAAAPALLDGLQAAPRSIDSSLARRASQWPSMPVTAMPARAGEDTPCSECEGVVPLDEYAKAVLYNGLGHYQAAQAAAQKACAGDEFTLLEGALFELVEASVRSRSSGVALEAVQRLEARARVNGSGWAVGMASCARALLSEDAKAEVGYLEAIDRLRTVDAPVTLGRVHLLYGEWLRRGRRRVEAREHLRRAHHVFQEVRLSGFAERARRELLATGETVRKRTDATRFDLTAWEAQIAQLAADHRTNPEIGELLFLSPRTVEWHLRKIFTKLGIRSRRELTAIFRPAAHDLST